MVTFPDEIHPKHGVRLRFDYDIRAYQYLDYFGITKKYKFIPLDLTFDSYNDLKKFLNEKGIVYQEIQVEAVFSKLSKIITIVDTRKIYDVEESVSKYLLNYKYYSINEVAEMLSFSRPTIYKLVNDQTLKAVRINGQYRINHLDIISFINKEN
jgi:excisionase family DNA binding protein